MSTRPWRGWLVAGAIFLLGVAAGAAGVTFLGIRAIRQGFNRPASARGLADRAAERIGVDLTKNLQLNPQESAQIQAILNESAANLKALRVQVATQAAAELDATTKRIAALLPPEKHAEFYRVMERRYQQMGLSPPTTNQW